MPSHIVDSEEIFVTPGDPAPLTLTYSTADPEGANAGSFSFFVALDASALLGGAPSDIDENPDLSGIQLAEGIITNTEFDIDGDNQPDDELIGFSASEDTDDLDNDPNTDLLINFVYTPIPAEGQPFSWPFQDTGQTEVELATVQLQTAEDLEETTVNFVLNEPSSQNPDPDNPDGPPLNEAFDGEEGDILGTAEVAAQAAGGGNIEIDVDNLTFRTPLSEFRSTDDDPDLVRANSDRVDLGDNLVTASLTVTNNGQGNLTLSEILIPDALTEEDEVTVDRPLATGAEDDILIAPGNSETFTFGFNPAEEGVNLEGNSVTFVSDDPDGDLVVDLFGRSTFRSDISFDEAVNLTDLGPLNASFGTADGVENFDPTADINFDGSVNLTDLGPLNAEFGDVIS